VAPKPVKSRVSTGIKGLDNLIEGGFPNENIIVLTGGPGTGKTIWGIQFLVQGAMNGEKGALVSVEQYKEDIISQSLQFGWDLEKLEKKGLLDIYCLSARSLFEQGQQKKIFNKIKKDGYKRLLIDSITSMIYSQHSIGNLSQVMTKGSSVKGLSELTRTQTSYLIDEIKSIGITTIATAQQVKGMPGETLDTISEFKSDGLLILNNVEIGVSDYRTLRIEKMRKSDHYKDLIPFDIKQNGIIIREKEIRKK
jgi:circadian clock protein KaiC